MYVEADGEAWPTASPGTGWETRLGEHERGQEELTLNASKRTLTVTEEAATPASEERQGHISMTHPAVSYADLQQC